MTVIKAQCNIIATIKIANSDVKIEGKLKDVIDIKMLNKKM